jgi:hypothetical protein
MVTGEVDQEVFDNLGNNTLSVRFEITIVKVRTVLFCYVQVVLTVETCIGAMVAPPWDPVPASER